MELPSGEATPVMIPGPSVNLASLNGGDDPNIVPDLCRATLDYRLVSGQSSEQVVKAVDDTLDALRVAHPQLRVERRVLLRAEPLFTDPACDLVRSLGQAVQSVSGKAAGYFGKTGTADANLVHERLDIPVFRAGNDDQQVIEIRYAGRQVQLPVWVLPGMADDAVGVTFGF